MQGAFISAVTFRPPLVLGRQLLPFSPWHGLILEAAASPYLCTGTPKMEDFIFGVWVCSHNFSEGYKAATDIAAAGAWGKGLKKYSKNKRIDFTGGMAAFSEYIEASFCAPKYWESGEEGKIRAPYWWHCVYFIQKKLHMTEAQAWDYPIARTVCYQACEAEINGNKNLASDDEIRALEKENK